MKNILTTTVFRQLFRVLNLTLLVNVALISQSALAQNTGERWYQVELIAFARQSLDQQEQWFNNLKLGYPLNWIELKNPNEPETASNTTINNVDEEISTPTVDLSRSPFYLLPNTEFKLSHQVSALARHSRFRVLLHQAWRQPMTTARNAPAILIHGGRTYGEHSELAGSITLSVGQLLQINTRLWLTQFEINYGQAPEDWPSLPESPYKLKQAILAQAEALDTQLLIPDEIDPWSLPPAPLSENATEPAAEAYLPQRIVVMEEERKMRSKELHYIDHPLLGLVIQLTPYTPPATEATPAPL